jgi:hypothetical protein
LQRIAEVTKHEEDIEEALTPTNFAPMTEEEKTNIV